MSIPNLSNTLPPASARPEAPLPMADPAPESRLPEVEAIAPSAFPVALTADPTNKAPNTAATISEVAQTRKPWINPSFAARRPAIKAPAARLRMIEIADQTTTVVPAPLTGSSEVGSTMENPRLVPRVDSSSDTAKTVITPPITLPHDIFLTVANSFATCIVKLLLSFSIK
ncbi:hypothetical protein D3C80_1115570 [compost metagenome]